MGEVTEIKFFSVLWILFMALYFIFGAQNPVWNTMFYCVTILLGVNNATYSTKETDQRWKNISSTVLKSILSFFVLCYLIPPMDNPVMNSLIGALFVIITVFNLWKDYDKGD